MTTPSAQQSQLIKSAQLLAEINRLAVKAFKSKKKENLYFEIVNDSVVIAKYDRAVLWKMAKGKPSQLLAVSGQISVNKEASLSKQWMELLKKTPDLTKVQLLNSPDGSKEVSILWMPLFAYERPALGLWLEKWNNVAWTKEEIDLLQFLGVSYSAASEKFVRRFEWKKLLTKPAIAIAILALLASFFITIPLRIVGPCEIVPKDPIVISAPLEGIIDEILVHPGQGVSKGTLIVTYDKRVPLQDLKVAQKKVEIIKSEVGRATAMAEKDKKALAELGVDALKLKKEELELQLAQFRASQLNILAPDAGVVMLDNPEEWRGKPVKIGEKILTIADPTHTKIRIWISEDDNVPIDFKHPVKIFLNITPEKSYYASLVYISSYTHLTEKGVNSFIAEAEWTDKQPEDVKLGLKGTAILYGEDVSIFYWIIRKPWGYVRHFFTF